MCPPGVDQTTRSAQQWNLLVPTLQHRQPLSLEPGCETRYCLSPSFSDEHWRFNAFDKLFKKPSMKTTKEPSQLDLSRQSSPCEELSPLEALPVELFNAVLDDASLAKKDIVALGSCSQTTWALVKPFILAHCRRHRISWVDQPVVCTGTWLMDLCPPLYEQLPEMKERERAWKAGETRSRWMVGPGMHPARQWNWGAVTDFKDVRDVEPARQWMSAMLAWSLLGFKESSVLKSELESAIRHGLGYESGKWILRNHTLKVSITLEVDTSDCTAAKAHLSGHPDLTLDVALLTRICWGSTILRNAPNCRDFSKGGWAGHRFDVVLAEEPDCEAGFRDVTRTLIRDCEMLMADG